MSYDASHAVTSARHLYRLTLGLGVFGLGAVLLALAAALTSISLVPPSGSAMLSACQQLIPAAPGVAGLVLLGLAGVAISVLARGGAAFARELVAQRRLVRGLSVHGRAYLHETAVAVTADSRPQAFCAGYLRPRIYVSDGALDVLAPAELRAVLAHERHHAVRRDPLRALVGRVLANALFFLPALRRSSERYDAVAELAADEAAVRDTGDRRGLAAALLRFEDAAAPAGAVGVAPERVDHLLGQGAGWRLPVWLLAGSLLLTAGLAALALLAASTAGQAAINLPMILASSCMVLMLAVPAALVGWSLSRSVRSRLSPMR